MRKMWKMFKRRFSQKIKYRSPLRRLDLLKIEKYKASLPNLKSRNKCWIGLTIRMRSYEKV